MESILFSKSGESKLQINSQIDAPFPLKGSSILKLKEIISFSDQNDFESKYLSAINSALKKDIFLVLYKFEYFQSDLSLIQKLFEDKVKFIFLDLPKLKTKSDLSFLMSYISYKKIDKGDKIKEGIANRIASGKKQGFGNLSKEKQLKIISAAHKKRKMNTFLNEINIELRKKIIELKEKKKLSYQKIANFLNEEGYTNSRKNPLSPKNIERLIKNHLALINIGKTTDECRALEINTQIRMNANALIDNKKYFNIVGIKNDFNVHEELKFTIENDLKEPIKIEIRDNSNNTIWNKDFAELPKEFIFNLKDLYFLPGRYFLVIKSINPESTLNAKVVRFFMRKDILPKECFEVNLLMSNH